jgi:hypothetical protein
MEVSVDAGELVEHARMPIDARSKPSPSRRRTKFEGAE